MRALILALVLSIVLAMATGYVLWQHLQEPLVFDTSVSPEVDPPDDARQEPGRGVGI